MSKLLVVRQAPGWCIMPCLLLLFAVVSVLCGCGPVDGTPAFDGDRAFGFLKQQVEIGPRYSGVPGHEETIKYIEAQVKPYASEVRRQNFTADVRGKNLDMTNIIAQFNPQAKKWVLLAAHWDTRPTADMELDPVKKKQPIPGANDGASGVAVLLELARVFAAHKPDIGVMMVFFDGEDYGPTMNNMFLGAKYFAANLKDSTKVNGKPVKIEYGLLLDMVGDKDLQIPKEPKSMDAAPDVVKKVWTVADKLGYSGIFTNDIGPSIQDDHIPLIRAGIKCIDLIDFNYGPWHTLDDTPDQCSAKSLKTVGEVVAKVVYEENAD